MPRSGTTWIGKIFDSHPQTFYLHEPDHGAPSQGLPAFIPRDRWDELASELRNRYSQFLHRRSPRVACKLPVFEKSYRSWIANRANKLAVPAFAAVSRLSPGFSVPAFANLQDGQIRIVWKSISSLGRIGAFSHALNHVKPVVIMRHPCGHIASTLRGANFMSKTPASEKLGYLEDARECGILQHYRIDREQLQRVSPVERLAWRWVINNHKGIEDLKEHSGYCLIYENVAMDPVKEIHRVFEYAGLTWESPVDQFLSVSSTHNSSEYFSVYRDSEAAAFTWKGDLSDADIKKIMDVVAGTLPWSVYVSEASQPLAASFDQQ